MKEALQRFVDAEVVGVDPARFAQIRAFRVFLLLSAACWLALTLVNLAVDLATSAALACGGAALLALLIALERRGPGGGGRRALEVVAVGASLTLASAIGFLEVPSKTESFYFEVLVLLAALLIEGRSAWRWVALACVQVAAACAAEGLLWGGAPGALAGKAVAVSIFYLFFWGAALSVRKPIDEAIAAVSASSARLAETNASLERALRSRSEFLANMSHEIRTPLNAVIGTADLLMRSPLRGEQEELVRTIQVAGQGLLVLLNDVLDLAKLESSKLDINRSSVPLRRLLFDVIDMMAARADEKGLELIGDVEPSVPTLLEVDPARLRQIVVNLLGNAVKFTDQGHVLLRARWGEGRLRVEVIDTGVGLSPGERSGLFQPFSQATAGLQRAQGGTGLGLAICRRLTELMGGDIGVDSEPGRGSTFWLELPCEAGPEPRGPAAAGVAALIVDPNPLAGRALVHLLGAALPGEQRLATSLGDACAMLEGDGSFLPGLCFVDASVADEAGLARLSRLRPGCRLIALTDAPRPPDAPFEAALTRPLRPERIRRCLAPPEPPREAPGAAGEPWCDGSVLVVEDNAVNQRVLSKMLAKLGYRHSVASGGQEALDQLALEPFDVVLMDIQMPGKDGVATTRELRAREVGPRRTVVVAVTANAFVEDQRRYEEAEMDDFLSKPIRMDDLATTLERWLRPASARRQA